MNKSEEEILNLDWKELIKYIEALHNEETVLDNTFTFVRKNFRQSLILRIFCKLFVKLVELQHIEKTNNNCDEKFKEDLDLCYDWLEIIFYAYDNGTKLNEHSAIIGKIIDDYLKEK